MDGVWEVSFDGETCREGVGDGFRVRPLGGRNLNYSYKLAFDCMNNEVEYEAMILAILVLKELQVKRVVLHGYSKLIIKQMTSEYQAIHPCMRSCQDAF